MNCAPLNRTVLLFKLFDKLFVFNLFKIGNVTVIHDGKLCLISSQSASISGVWIVRTSYPEMLIKEKS